MGKLDQKKKVETEPSRGKNLIHHFGDQLPEKNGQL